jgi:hypothetical protein
MKAPAYPFLIALAVMGLQLSSCVRPVHPNLIGELDHTGGALITDPRECACLARLKLVNNGFSKTPCLSDVSGGICAIRLDCEKEAREPLRTAALSCRAGG